MKAIILARVSTEEQKEAGNSLPSQVYRLETYLKSKDIPIAKRFVFDESAYKTDNKKEFSKVIQFIKDSKEPVALCCDKIDRLIRNFTMDLIFLEEMRVKGKIELHFPSDNVVLHKDSPAPDLFRFTMGVCLAKYFSDSIRDNVKRGYEQKIRNREWPQKAPIGYKNISLENGTKTIILDKERDFLIKKAFELYATGKYSMRGLAKEMQKLGLRNTLKKPLYTSRIEKLLKHPFYYGMMPFKGELCPHKYPPIISLNLFNQVQDVIKSYNKRPYKRSEKPFVFRGLIQCQNCGCTITPELQKGKYIYYHCTNYYGNCNNVVWVKEEELLRQASGLLRSLKLDQESIDTITNDLRAIHEGKNEFYKKNVGRIERRIKQIDTYIETMYQDRLEGRITTDMFDEKVKTMKKEQKDLHEQLKDFSCADEKYLISANRVLDLASRAYELFERSEPQQKRQMLDFILQNSFLKGKKLIFELKTPFDGILEYANSGNRRPGQDLNLRPTA